MTYRKESLGRTAAFLIPVQKNELVHDEIIAFLTDSFDSCTFSDKVYNGYYKKKFEGKFIKYKVSFVGKDRIPALDKFLEKIARKIDEECLWVSTGEDDYLIYPI